MDGRIDIAHQPKVPTPPASTPTAVPKRALAPFSIRATRTVFFALITVLVLRAIFIEPFGVPTGSMAPTILGVHRDINCPNCGYPVRVGEPPEPITRGFFDVTCGNCGARNLGLESALPA